MSNGLIESGNVTSEASSALSVYFTAFWGATWLWSALIKSAAFSAVAYTELTMFPLTLLGKTLASATRNPLTPFTRSRLSRTLPMAQVPIGWYSERTQSLFPCVSAGLQGDAWQLTELPLWIAQCLGGRLQEQGIGALQICL